MSCIGCQPTKPVLNCIDDLVIGTVSEVNTGYNVYFENASNGKVIVESIQSGGDGVLTVTLGFTPLADTEYKVWVTLTDATNVDATEPITIDGIEADCLFVTFKRIYGTDNANITATSQTLSI